MVAEINAAPGSREALEARYGQVWDTSELTRDFTVLSFAAPFVVVTRKSDSAQGSMMFQATPPVFTSVLTHTGRNYEESSRQ
jgi:hypothetical protein